MSRRFRRFPNRHQTGKSGCRFITGCLSWALAVLSKRQRCVRLHEAGPYERLKRTEPIAPVSTAAR